MKFGLEIELMAYEKNGQTGQLGHDFNRFRKKFGNTIEFTYFNNYPRYNKVKQYSFLSNEGNRYYLESPKTIEVVTPPISINNNNLSENLVGILKQGVNNVLKHYSHLNFVPYSIHLNVSSTGSIGSDRLFWNQVSPMTLFLGTNPTSKGIGARFHTNRKQNIFDKLNNRVEILIDGETICFENQLEILCEYYKQSIQSEGFGKNPTMVLSNQTEIPNMEKNIKAIAENKFNFNDFSFSKRVINTNLKNNKSLNVEELLTLGYAYIKKNIPLKKFFESYKKTMTFNELIILKTEEIENFFENESYSNFLYNYITYSENEIPHNHFFTGDVSIQDDEFNEIDLISNGENLDKFIQRGRFFQRIQDFKLNNNGKIAPVKFPSIDYSMILNSNNLFQVNKKHKHKIGKLTQNSDKIQTMDWNSVEFKNGTDTAKVMNTLEELDENILR
jgi:hypothetical protein